MHALIYCSRGSTGGSGTSSTTAARARLLRGVLRWPALLLAACHLLAGTHAAKKSNAAAPTANNEYYFYSECGGGWEGAWGVFACRLRMPVPPFCAPVMHKFATGLSSDQHR